MITRINFNIDPELKSEAMKKAKERGLSLSTVLSEATCAFANDQLDIGLVDQDLAEDIIRSRKDIENGRLTSQEELIKELRLFEKQCGFSTPTPISSA